MKALLILLCSLTLVMGSQSTYDRDEQIRRDAEKLHQLDQAEREAARQRADQREYEATRPTPDQPSSKPSGSAFWDYYWVWMIPLILLLQAILRSCKRQRL